MATTKNKKDTKVKIQGDAQAIKLFLDWALDNMNGVTFKDVLKAAQDYAPEAEFLHDLKTNSITSNL